MGMNRAGLKEVARKYKDELKKFQPHLDGIEKAISSYEETMKGANEHIASGMVERIKKVREGIDKFAELNAKIEALRENL